MSVTDRDFNDRYDGCMLDFLAKAGIGAFIGLMFGSFFLRRGRQFALVGASVGTGMAYVNCESSLNQYLNMKRKPNVCKTLSTQMEQRRKESANKDSE